MFCLSCPVGKFGAVGGFSHPRRLLPAQRPTAARLPPSWKQRPVFVRLSPGRSTRGRPLVVKCHCRLGGVSAAIARRCVREIQSTGAVSSYPKGLKPWRIPSLRVHRTVSEMRCRRGCAIAATGSAGFAAGPPSAHLDAAPTASAAGRRPGLRSAGGSAAVPCVRRRRSRAGGIEPPARGAGWKAGGPSPGRPAGQVVDIPPGSTSRSGGLSGVLRMATLLGGLPRYRFPLHPPC
jgi:hypothetical protein